MTPERTERNVISATDQPPFGSHRFRIPFDAAGKKWVRLRCLGLRRQRRIHAASPSAMILLCSLFGPKETHHP
jgi:hypothetical protein